VVAGGVGPPQQRDDGFSVRRVEIAQRHHVHDGQRNPVP
jgi:hypothetical protein